MRLSVSEHFYSLQGEGVTTGVPAIFLRLAGCNLMCGGQGTERDGKLHDGATWRCDTIEVWLKGRSKTYPELIAEMDGSYGFLSRLREGAHLVVTGGEPLLQEKGILGFLEYLETTHHLRPIIEVETNGTCLPSEKLAERVRHWNCSPKLSNSGMAVSLRIFPEVLRWFDAQPGIMFKFVIDQEYDWKEIFQDFISPGLCSKSNLVLMPAADSLAALLEKNKLVADICIRECVRMCTRLHVEIWDRLTGV